MFSSAKDIGSGTAVDFNLKSFLAGGGGAYLTDVSSDQVGLLRYAYCKPVKVPPGTPWIPAVIYSLSELYPPLVSL